MFRIDTHMHTSETSACGNIRAKDEVRLYHQAGYQGMIITDHYYEGFFRPLGKMSWEDKIDRYLYGYRIACEEGAKLGMKVFLGLELRFTEGPNDYLVYGMSEEYLRNHKELYELGLMKFRELIKDEDILIVQAHPYRKWMTVMSPAKIHGIEVYNGNARHDSRNELALAYAKEHNLYMTSGSDFHELEDLSRGGMVFDHDIKTIQEFIQGLRERSAIELIATP